MSEYSRLIKVRTMRLGRAIGKSAMVFSLSFAGYFALISDTRGPVPYQEPALIMPEIPAVLSFAGEDSLVTGSLHALFENKVFRGPNRAEKRGRIRVSVDGIAVASSFAQARQHIAQARPKKLIYPGGLHARDSLSDTQRIAIASIEPGLVSAALDAIEGVSRPKAPIPLNVSSELAYVRANEPATVFNAPAGMKVASKQSACLATAIYFEARGESYRGQAAVAQVVLNRVKHSVYPNTICGVVYQNQSRRNACQFSFACDGIPERVTETAAWNQSKEVAQKVLSGEVYLPEVANSTHYHATYVSPRWAPRLRKMTKIGLHIFYRFRSS